jgi:hypothetical protein
MNRAQFGLIVLFTLLSIQIEAQQAYQSYIEISDLKWHARSFIAPQTGKLDSLILEHLNAGTADCPDYHYLIYIIQGGLNASCPDSLICNSATTDFINCLPNTTHAIFIGNKNFPDNTGATAGTTEKFGFRLNVDVKKDSLYTIAFSSSCIGHLTAGTLLGVIPVAEHGFNWGLTGSTPTCGGPGGGFWAEFQYAAPVPDSNWVWIGGDSLISQQGDYGQKGVSMLSNWPSARSRSVSWQNNGNEVLVFGGEGNTNTTYLNDLWKWNGVMWTWISGDSIANQSGVYGIKGTASPNNKPGARIEAVSWYGNNGNYWLYGGRGYDGSGNNGYLNDLWKWDGSQWTWVSGNATTNASGQYGTLNNTSSQNLPGARYRAMSWVDAAGNLFLFGGEGYDANGSFGYLNDMWKFDGTNWTWVKGSSTINANGNYGQLNISHTANEPGSRNRARVWTNNLNETFLFGGQGRDGGGALGFLNDLWKWDGTNWTWMSGDSTVNSTSDYGTIQVPSNTNKIGSRFGSVSWIDNSNNLWLFGGFGKDSASANGHLNDLWQWNGQEWVWMNGSKIKDQNGNYVSNGGVAPNGGPGGRYGGVSWTDSLGWFYHFGGLGNDVNGNLGKLNDIWRIGYESTVNCNLSHALFADDSLSVCGDSVLLDAGSGYAQYHWSTGDTTQTILVRFSGTYSVRVTNYNSCTAKDTIRVHFIRINANSADSLMCHGDSTMLTALQPTFESFGDTIKGELMGSVTGRSVSLSNNGQVVAIGEPGNGLAGSVRVFENVQGSWTQLGQKLALSSSWTSDQGWTVSLSADGQTLATNSQQEVNVYALINSTWIGKGSTVLSYGSNEVECISLSSNGNVIAVGEPYYDSVGTNSGRIKIFEYVNNAWSQKGASIYGGNADGLFGYSLALSHHGDVLVVGAPGELVSGSNASGETRVFQFNNGSWSQIGQVIGGGSAINSGVSVDIDQSGERIAIGEINTTFNSCQLKVFELINGNWVQMGNTIIASGSITHNSVSIAGSGSRVAFSLHSFNPSSSIYSYSNNSWVELEFEHGLNFVECIALNYSGDVCALSQPFIDVDRGQVNIFKDFSSTYDFQWFPTGDTTSSITVSPNQTTAYYVTVSDGIGSCTDSITVYVNPIDSTTQIQSACNDYTWTVNARTYTSSGVYRDTLVSSAGCDSILILDLTINQPDTTYEVETACGNYIWPVTNQNYSTSGLYRATLTNQAGCDSVIELNLTINDADSVYQSASACDSFTWPVNNQTYASSGLYSATLSNGAGCDSVVYLDLTINASNVNNINVTACDSFYWNSTSQTYFASGNYLVQLQNIFGCDSTVVLNLTINNSSSSQVQVSSCDFYVWPMNGQSYTQSGTYTHVVNNSAGCDSTITLQLTIHTTDITQQPANQQVFINDTAVFALVANPSNATYQWQSDVGFGFQNLNNAGQYAGTHTNTLSVYNAAISNNNQVFRCNVSANGCDETSNNAVLTVIDNFGIDENTRAQLIKLYPNPTKDHIDVEADDVLIGREYYITDAAGKLMFKGKLNRIKSRIFVDDWKAGEYIFTIEGVMNQKFSVVK